METRDSLLALHQEILAGTPDASLRAYDAIQHSLPRLVRVEIGQSLSLSSEECRDLAVDAFMVYLRAPHKFDPSRAGLMRYLVTIARSGALRLGRRKGRHENIFSDPVELDPVAVYRDTEPPPDNDPMTLAIVEQSTTRARELRAQLQLDTVEERVLTLMLSGERSTEVFADAMGILAMPTLEQRRQVKRCKDKIEKRIARLGANADE